MNVEIGNMQNTSLGLLFTIIGCYGIFIKLGHKSKLAFIPYVNLAMLGDVVDMPKTGIITAFFGILSFGFMCTNIYIPDDLNQAPFVLAIFFAGLAIDVVYILFRTILLNGLRKVFGRKWVWMLPFIFIPGVTLAYWGYSKKIQV